jgi:hypothetical protein
LSGAVAAFGQSIFTNFGVTAFLYGQLQKRHTDQSFIMPPMMLISGKTFSQWQVLRYTSS